MNADYPIEALDILLDKDCLTARYFPLIEYKSVLLSELLRLGSKTKSDAQKLNDDVLINAGLNDMDVVGLFRAFLAMYDPKPQKFKEITKRCSNPDEISAYTELYHLPGVKYVRASLYYRSGYTSLADIAAATADDILEKTARTIESENMSCIVPLPKEVRTHIAVAKAFTMGRE